MRLLLHVRLNQTTGCFSPVLFQSISKDRKGSCKHLLISPALVSSVWINEIPTGLPPSLCLVLGQQLPVFVAHNEMAS